MIDKTKKKPWDAVKYLHDLYVKDDPEMQDLIKKAKEARNKEIKYVGEKNLERVRKVDIKMKKQTNNIDSKKLKKINSEIESLRKQLKDINLSSKDRADCEEKLMEELYDKKTFTITNQKEKKTHRLKTQIDSKSLIDCLIENAIIGTFKWIIQKKQKITPNSEFLKNALWIFDSGEKENQLLTFKECCIFSEMNYRNIWNAIYRVSRMSIKEIKDILAKFKIKQERKHTELEEDPKLTLTDIHHFKNSEIFFNTFIPEDKYEQKIFQRGLRSSDWEETNTYLNKK